MLSFLISYFAASCNTRYFLGIPSWDRYLIEAGKIRYDSGTESCQLTSGFFTNDRLDFSVVSLAGLGVLDILLRLAALVAVGFVIYGGIQYVISQGEPERTKRALGTITNALIGLAIAVFAAVVVAFIGNTVG